MSNRKLFIVYSIIFFALISLMAQISNAHPLDNWHLRSHFPVGTVLYRAIYANNFFVGVGWDAMGYGVIYTSSDGIIWNKRNIGGTNPLGCITYGNNIIVVGGAYGTILTSFDGITWIERDSGTTKTFYAITYGNNIFVAVGESGGIFTSPDGITWNERNSGMTNPLYAVAYGNNRFVAGGRTSGHILTSPDGITWTAGEYIGYSYDWYDIVYANNIFVGVGTMGTIFTSLDGVNWTYRYLPPVDWTPDFYGITYGNNTFVAVGHWWGDSETFISSDGITWTQTQSGTESQSLLYAVTFGNNTFVAFAEGYSGFVTVDSPNGLTWIERGPGDGVNLIDIAYGNNTFVAVGATLVAPVLLTSIDGITWLDKVGVTYSSSLGLNAVAFGNNMFVVVGENGIVLTSSDGISWTETHLEIDYYGVPDSPALIAVAYGNDTFIVHGDKGDGTYLFFTSQDGVTWTERGPGPPLESIIYAQKTFVAVGRDDDILTSPDGITWTKRWTMYPGHINNLTYGKSLFVAVGVSIGNWTDGFGLITTSPDGINWTPTIINIETVLTGITYNNHTFVAVGTNGIIVTSFDGITWQQRQSGMGGFTYYSEGHLQSVTFGNNTFVAVGTFGAILQSDPIDEIISTPSIDLQSPDINQLFDPCSLITKHQPTFTWTTNGTFTRFSILFSTFSTDFTTPIVRASIGASRNGWTPSLKSWKSIMTQSYNSGNTRDIYWKVIGTTSSRTTVESEVRNFQVGTAQTVTIQFPGDGDVLSSGTPPTFIFDTNCNTKFRLEFSSLNDFSDTTKIKGFAYTVRDTNTLTTLQKTLTPGQWNAVKKLISSGTGFFRIKAWDGISRETKSEVRAFTIQY